MTNQPKTPGAMVPTNCRQRLAAEGKPYPRSSCQSCGPFSPKWRECDALIDAAPAEQTPAPGGEPEVLAHVQGDHTLQWLADHWRLVPKGTELIDRAHVAPLQAEIERLKAQTFTPLLNDCNVLLARIAELEAQLAKANDWQHLKPDMGVQP